MSTLKHLITNRLWAVVDQYDYIRSATLTGSFLDKESLEGISDIDFVVIVDHLDADRYHELQRSFHAALAPELGRLGYQLRINPTLGPLKYNAPATAVLHLMLYSQAAHQEHVLQSPFTCYDWQRSGVYRRMALSDLYPVVCLQPRHFVGCRRSVTDYLSDFRAGLVSYRELECSCEGYREAKRAKPMDTRDRHEFAYHIMRFLMQNLLKLVLRQNTAHDTETTLELFFSLFSGGKEEFTTLFRQLAAKKCALDFGDPVEDLDGRLEEFVQSFETQFKQVFLTTATRHIVFRHARTARSIGPPHARVFTGQSEIAIEPLGSRDLAELRAAVNQVSPVRAYQSPRQRCCQSLAALAAHVGLGECQEDARLEEINYGACEGLSVTQARLAHPALFAAWERGEDPPFPGGGSTGEVLARARSFVHDCWRNAEGNTITCTHNVVLRCLIGSTVGLPEHLWHRLQIPHLRPITFIQTRDHGLFVEWDEGVERELFQELVHP